VTPAQLELHAKLKSTSNLADAAVQFIHATGFAPEDVAGMTVLYDHLEETADDYNPEARRALRLTLGFLSGIYEILVEPHLSNKVDDVIAAIMEKGDDLDVQ